MINHAQRQDQHSTGVRLTVFGGMHLYVGGAEVDIGPPRQRAILAMLVAARGESVSAVQLTQALWPGDAPASATNQIHRLVGNLRRVLEPHLSPRATGNYVTGNGHGYILSTDGLDSDLDSFFVLVEAGRSTDSDSERHHLAVQALTLAAAPAFAGLPVEIMSSGLFSRIHARRLALCSEVVGAVAAGDAVADDVLPLVERMAASEPLDENVQASHMRLLRLAGRRSDAVDVFEQTRRALADGLGIDPGTNLRSAYLELLDSEPVSLPAPNMDAPHSLPPATTGFIERTEVRSLLAEATASAVKQSGSIAVLSGMGGIGKTTLAVHWASLVATQFPDGQLYLNLFGYDPNRQPLSGEDGLNRLLEQLGMPKTIENAAERLSRYQSLIAGRRMIVLLDNAWDAEQVRAFLPNSPGSLTIVTSRNRLPGLLVREGARSIPLGRWGAVESRALFVQRLGSATVDAEPDAMKSIIEACAGLPLALAITAARSVLTPDLTLAELAEQLSESARVLDSLAASDDSDLRATFEWSYRALPPAAARMFRYLAAHPGPSMSLSSIATLTGGSLAETGRLVDSLVTANMAVQVQPDRIELHDLLRAYASELLDECGERTDADQHLIEHYVRSTRQAYLRFGRDPTVQLELEEPGPESVDHFSSDEEALAWFATERPALFAVLRRASAIGLSRQAALIALDWRPMSWKLDSNSDAVDACRVAYDAAVKTDEPVLIAELSRDLGSRFAQLGDFDAARSFTLRALGLFQELDDPVGQANTYRNLSVNAGLAGDSAGELEYSQQSVRAARLSGRPEILALSLDEFAIAVSETGDLDAVYGLLIESLEQARLAGPDFDPSTCLLALASNAIEREDFAAALDWANQARADGHNEFDPRIGVGLESTLALASMELGLVDEATTAVSRFDDIVERVGDQAFGLYDPAGAIELRQDIERTRAWISARSAPAIDERHLNEDTADGDQASRR